MTITLHAKCSAGGDKCIHTSISNVSLLPLLDFSSSTSNVEGTFSNDICGLVEYTEVLCMPYCGKFSWVTNDDSLVLLVESPTSLRKKRIFFPPGM